jgi:predicted aspartyl protease
MGYRGLLLILCPLILLATADRVQAAEACELKRVAELHADTSTGSLLITIQIEGHDTKVMMDTGSSFNLISPRLAAQLNLTKTQAGGDLAIDGSGHALRNFVNVHKMGLGGMTAENVPFLVFGESGSLGDFDGVFGANFLEAYDVELDLAHNKVNLFLPNKCAAAPVYWTQDFDELPFRVDASMHAVLQVTLDGHPLTALLDTGSSMTNISQLVARRTFGIDPEASGTEPDGHVSTGTGATLPFYRHKFSTFEIRGAAFRNTELAIVPLKVNHFIEDKRYGNHTSAEENMVTQVTVALNISSACAPISHFATISSTSRRQTRSSPRDQLILTPINRPIPNVIAAAE